MAQITIVINTLNEEKNLPGCLESVTGWADEVVVVDMHSIDHTREIAEAAGSRFFLHEPTEYVEPARNFAIGQASHDWVLVLDADERVSPGLAAWMREYLDGTASAAFKIPRRNYYGDVWVTCCGWFPDEQVRLYRKGKVRYSDRIHRAPEIDGEIEQLPLNGEAYLLHYAFADLHSRMEKNNKYSLIAARSMFEEGKRINARGLLFRTFHSFWAAYLFQRGYRFGTLGAMLALERSFATFLKYAKLWELSKKER